MREGVGKQYCSHLATRGSMNLDERPQNEGNSQNGRLGVVQPILQEGNRGLIH